MGNFNKRPTDIQWSDAKQVDTLISKLIRSAFVRGFLIGNPEARQVFNHKHGQDIPERLRPGAMLFELTTEEREALQDLKAEDIPVDRSLVGIKWQ